MRHEDFKVDGKYIELHASQKFCVIVSEGNPDFFFDQMPAGEILEQVSPQLVPEEIRATIARGIRNPDDRNYSESH